MLHRSLPTVRDSHLDLKRVAAINAWWPSRRCVELTWHDVVQSFKNQLLTNRRNAIRRRRSDPGRLNRLKERVGFLATNPLSARSRRDFRRRANLPRDLTTHPRKRVRKKLRHSHIRVVLQQRNQPPQLHAVRVRLDLLRLRRQFI